MPYKDPERQREYQRVWARRNRKSQREYVRRIRKKVLEMLGGKCVYCGCDISEALEINHIYGGGRKETRGKNKQFLLDIYKGRRLMDDLELTCSICNTWHKLTKLQGIEDRWTIIFH